MAQNLGPTKVKVAQPPPTIVLICITLLFGTETPGQSQHCQKEGSINLYSIKSVTVNNDADEFEDKIWADWNNNVNLAAQKDFI